MDDAPEFELPSVAAARQQQQQDADIAAAPIFTLPSEQAASAASAAAKGPLPPETDYGSMSYWDALKAGRESAPEAGLNIAQNFGNAAVEGVNNIREGKLPGQSYIDAGLAMANKYVPGAAWANDRLNGLSLNGRSLGPGKMTDDEYNKTAAPLTDVATQYATDYGSQAGFKKKLATDLPGVVLDALSIADPALRAGSFARNLGTKAVAAAPATAADLGEAFINATKQSKDAVSSAYDKAWLAPGQLKPDAVHPIWSATQDALNDVNGLSADVLANSPSFAQTRAAIAHLRDRLTNIPDNELDMPRMEILRRDLRAFGDAQGIEGGDKYAIGKLVDGFDKGVEKAASVGNAGVAEAFQNARAAHVNHLKTFGSEAPGTVKNAIRELPPNLSDADPGHFHQTGTKLASSLMNNTTGPALYQHLSNIGLKPTVDDFMRQQMLQGTQKEVAKNLGMPTAKPVFGGDLPRAQKLNVDRGKPTVGRRLAPITRAALDVGLSGFGAHAAGLPGLVLGHLAEKGVERFLPSTAEKIPLHEQFTAPPTKPVRDFTRGLTARGARTNVLNAAGEEPPDNAPPPNELTVHRSAHARGGKVGHQHLVNRLFRHVERARREEKAHTSSLLNLPDKTVATALNTAQEAI